jgi:beta-galactosidase
MIRRITPTTAAALLLAIAVCFAETYTPEASNRVKINLGETPWKFMRSDPNGTPQASSYSDGTWKDVGVPHTYNDSDTYINQQSGGGDGSMYGGTVWYRKHFTLDNQYSSRKIFVEFEGAHVATQVYINDTLMKGNSAINPNATHVVGFVGFVVDITPYVKFGGADNVLAVRVLKGNATVFEDPGFSEVFRFGQEDGGLFRPVWLHITDKVHVPLNVYSVLNKWGTYVATTAASDASATISIQTNVQNENATAQAVTLTTKIVDYRKGNNVVWTGDATQSIAAGQSYMFTQTATVSNPTLWYPNNSSFGKPYMYKVYHIVKIGGVTADVFESPLGIRKITWDANFPYINGHKHLLYGASARYDYPALGTALPPEVEWRDAKLLADIGGNLWRPGHSSCSEGFVDACDNLGVMLIQPSGEGEGAFSTGANPPADRVTLKKELHRDMIIRDRNNPSILSWEASNGDIDPTTADALRSLVTTWDNITPRAQSVRGGPQWAAGDLASCTMTGCEILVKSQHAACPSWGAEAWGRQSARFAYDYELQFAGEFIQNWKKARENNCFGLCQWYLAETPGENPASSFVEGTPGTSCRSFGSSMMDFNRIPKFLYHIYGAAWTSDTIKPQVAIAHHWNRSGTVTVNVFSNCPKVRLSINGVSQGDKVPNAWNIGTDGTSQTSTDMPMQCSWNVTWATGTLLAQGLDANNNVLCSDQKVTAATPDHIVLSVDSHIVKPDGETFTFKANATDAALILATVVDKSGNWCPTASGNMTWSVSGPGNYRGGADQLVTAGQPLGYHSPLDKELAIEGGMCKVAVRTTFTPGTVTITATSPNLGTGTTSFDVVALDGTPVRRPAAFLTSRSDVPRIEIESFGGALRYFVSSPCLVSFDILNAGGKVVRRVAGSNQGQGWHILQPKGSREIAGNGIHFVRCSVNGNALVKRVCILH